MADSIITSISTKASIKMVGNSFRLGIKGGSIAPYRAFIAYIASITRVGISISFRSGYSNSIRLNLSRPLAKVSSSISSIAS